MIKKILKIVGIVLLLLVISLFAIPYFFEDQIKAKIAAATDPKRKKALKAQLKAQKKVAALRK